MWKRIYLAGLAVSILVMAFFTYYAWSWIQSIGSPRDAAEGFLFHFGLGAIFLYLSSATLLVLANFILGRDLRSWAMWATFVYFAAFVILRSFWLAPVAGAAFSGEMLGYSTSYSPVWGSLLCIAAAAIVYADQFIVVRLHKKLYPPVNTTEAQVQIEPEGEISAAAADDTSDDKSTSQ